MWERSGWALPDEEIPQIIRRGGGGGDHRKGICRGGTDVQCRGRLAGDSTVGLVPGLAVAAVHTSASGMSGEVRVLLLPGEDHVHCT